MFHIRKKHKKAAFPILYDTALLVEVTALELFVFDGTGLGRAEVLHTKVLTVEVCPVRGHIPALNYLVNTLCSAVLLDFERFPAGRAHKALSVQRTSLECLHAAPLVGDRQVAHSTERLASSALPSVC